MDLRADLANQSVLFAAWTTATGAPVTVTSATAGLALWYRRGVAGLKIPLTTATTPAVNDLATLDAAHADAGILVIQGAEHRFDLPDAACAAGALTVSWGGSATGITIDGGTANLIGQANSASEVSSVAADAIDAAAIKADARILIAACIWEADTATYNTPASFGALANAHTPQTGDVYAALPTNFSDLSVADTTGLVATAATQHVIVDSGTVTTVTTLTNLPAAPADWLAAAAVKADAVTKIQAGLAVPGSKMDLVDSPNADALIAIRTSIETAGAMLALSKAILDKLDSMVEEVF